MIKATTKQPPINITPPRFVKNNPTYYQGPKIGGSGTSKRYPSTPGLTKYVKNYYVVSGYVTMEQP
jgi:hypothetical protein